MNTVHVLTIGIMYEGSSIVSIHATEAGAVRAAEVFMDNDEDGRKWKAEGSGFWKAGFNVLLIEHVSLKD